MRSRFNMKLPYFESFEGDCAFAINSLVRFCVDDSDEEEDMEDGIECDLLCRYDVGCFPS